MSSEYQILPGIAALEKRLHLVMALPAIARFRRAEQIALLSQVLGIRKSSIYGVLSGKQRSYSIFKIINNKMLNEAAPRLNMLPKPLRAAFSQSEWMDCISDVKGLVGVDRLIRKFGSQNPYKSLWPGHIWMDIPKQVVEKFFDDINEKDFKSAWSVLSTELRSAVWGNRFKDFENGYRNSTETACTDIQPIVEQSKDSVHFVAQVTIRCTTLIPEFSSLNGISNIPFNQKGIAELGRRLRSFRKEVCALGCDNPQFDEIMISLASRPSSGDAIRWLLDRNGNWDDQLSKREIKIAYVQEVSCRRESGRWAIRSLKRLA